VFVVSNIFADATSGMFLFFLALTVTGARYSDNPSHGVGILAVVWVWLHGVAYMLAWSGLLVAFTVEVLPFKLRAKGLTIMNLAIQIALVINQYVNPLAIGPDAAWENTGWKLYCIYTVWIFVELLVVYFSYPETRGPTLEEIARIFDGENAEVGTVDTTKGYDGLSNYRTGSAGHGSVGDPEKKGATYTEKESL
jgi:hypothetical protein